MTFLAGSYDLVSSSTKFSLYRVQIRGNPSKRAAASCTGCSPSPGEILKKPVRVEYVVDADKRPRAILIPLGESKEIVEALDELDDIKA